MAWKPYAGPLSDPVELLRSVQELRDGGVVILEELIPLLKDEGGDPRLRTTLAQMVSADSANQGGLLLIFLEAPEAECRLPALLADRFLRLEVPYPRVEELREIALQEVAKVNIEALSDAQRLEQLRTEAHRLASGLVGLTRTAARDALRDTLAIGAHDFGSADKRLQQRKAHQLRRELSMEVLSTEAVEMPVGLDYLIDYLRMLQPRMTQTGENRARGVLLIGPPGTGKTMIARAIGALVKLPVVEFKISSLMTSLLGETERRFSQAFAALSAMAPNVVFIDEIEKAFGDSTDRDGGTMMRCTGSLLSWLSENPHPNFIIATANNLSRMGEIGLTMTRSERFDCTFFIDVPCLEARQRMLEQWLRGAIPDHAAVAQELATFTDKFSGADLKSVVKQAFARAEYMQCSVSVEILRQEAMRKCARAIALYEEFQELRRWGRMFCDPAGLTSSDHAQQPAPALIAGQKEG